MSEPVSDHACVSPSDVLETTSPLAIGGVGGSGTRVVAAVAITLGVRMGGDLNEPLDNLAFTLLFKHEDAPTLPMKEFEERTKIFTDAMMGVRAPDAGERLLLQRLAEQERPSAGPVQHAVPWLSERVQRLAQTPLATDSQCDRWGWKEPNTHVVLPQLLQVLPTMRYVHVVRNGLDMAFSRNLNQLRLWGEWLLGRPVQPCPRDALAFWCQVHRRICVIARKMGSRFLWLDYDRLCSDPQNGLTELAEFMGGSPASVPTLRPLVRPQSTSGRHRNHPLGQFDPDDLDYLREIGHL